MLDHINLLKDIREKLMVSLNINIKKVKENCIKIDNKIKMRIATEYEIDKKDRLKYIEVIYEKKSKKISCINEFIEWYKNIYIKSNNNIA